MRNSILIFLVSFLGLGLISCDDERVVFKQMSSISNAMTWSDSVVFVMNIPDTSDRYQLFLTVDHDPQFKYENIYFKLHTHYPDNQGSSGLVSVQLQGDDGRWGGDCSSKSCSREVLLKDRIRFERSGDYYIAIRQASRDSILQGLHSIGLSLEKIAL